MCKRPLALVLIYFSLFSCVAAQSDQKRVRETAKMREKIIKCANKANSFSELKLRNGPKLTGPIYRPGDEKFSFIEIPSHRVSEIRYENVSSVWCGDFTARMNRRVLLICLTFIGIVAVAAR